MYGTNSSYVDPYRFIAHAGGEINGHYYTNSLQSLELNRSRGHILFEIDFDWTVDGQLVAIHDWQYSYVRLFNSDNPARLKNIEPSRALMMRNGHPFATYSTLKYLRNSPKIVKLERDNVLNLNDMLNKMPEKIPTLSEFRKLRMKEGLTQMSLEDVVRWISDNNDAYIVTDVKTDNIKALSYIVKKYPNAVKRIIPQIYHYNEYDEVANLGYDKIIFTLYRILHKTSHDEIVDFACKHKLFAVTMPYDVVMDSDLGQRLQNVNVRTYAHTVNSTDLYNKLKAKGVNNIYTDTIH